MLQRTSLVDMGHRIRVLLGILAWAISVVMLYNLGLWLAMESRVWLFDHACPPGLLHSWYSPDRLTSEYYLVDWCDIWWWHPFRLFTRLVFAVLVAFGMVSLGRRLLPSTSGASRGSNIFISVVAGVHILLNYVIFAGMVDMTSSACLWGWESAEVCREILGTFGDQRFYYPLTVVGVALYLSRCRNRK
jgi:hypothetical protein